MNAILAKLKLKANSETVDIIKTASIFIIMVIFATILSKGTILQPRNIVNLLNQNAILLLIALAQFLVILSGGIDLSVGAITAICSIIIVQYQDVGLFVVLFLAALAAAIIGFINGAIVTYRRLPAFVVTLAMMQIVYSLSKVISGGKPVYSSLSGKEIDPRLLALFQTKIFGISYPIIICIIAIVIVSLYMRTSYGRNIYAIGGNEMTAHLSGLPVKFVKVSVYIIAAILATAGSALVVARVGMGDPNTGDLLPLDSIAAVTIGGASMTGGVGTVAGTILGVLILSVLSNIMSLLNIPPTIQPAVKGVIILLAVYMNSRKKRA